MIEQSNQLIQRLWTYCNLLRDDGFSNSEYVEQLTYLLFLKMADERSKPPFFELKPLPADYSWEALRKAEGLDQLDLYQRALINLGGRPDLFGTIYRNASSRFRDPQKFQRLVGEINQLEWSKYDSDVKGDAYEGLLERTAADTKSGAGQYFTPRSLVDAIVDVIQPKAGETVCDPACGTGGFLLSWLLHPNLASKDQEKRRAMLDETISGTELVDSVARLCLMNMVLHGIGGRRNPVHVGDSLASKPSKHYDVVLANPPFGKKSSVTFVSDSGEKDRDGITIDRDDFWASTSNKQLNFVQHIFTMLKGNGRAAVIVPDNVLFEGGAGELIRRHLLKLTDLHTILRLPTGIFYAQGVKANVLFFDRKPHREQPWTERTWIYDLRTNKRFTLKGNPLRRVDLDDFVACYKSKNRQGRKETERFKSFSFEELSVRDKANLDISWLKDDSIEDSATLPPPHVLASAIMENLAAAHEQFAAIAGDFGRPLSIEES